MLGDVDQHLMQVAKATIGVSRGFALNTIQRAIGPPQASSLRRAGRSDPSRYVAQASQSSFRRCRQLKLGSFAQGGLGMFLRFPYVARYRKSIHDRQSVYWPGIH